MLRNAALVGLALLLGFGAGAVAGRWKAGEDWVDLLGALVGALVAIAGAEWLAARRQSRDQQAIAGNLAKAIERARDLGKLLTEIRNEGGADVPQECVRIYYPLRRQGAEVQRLLGASPTFGDNTYHAITAVISACSVADYFLDPVKIKESSGSGNPFGIHPSHAPEHNKVGEKLVQACDIALDYLRRHRDL